MNNNIQIYRKWSMPNKNTFSIKPIKELIIQEKTKGLWIDPFANSRIVKKGGKVISFGWNSGGIGDSYGFCKTKILLVAHGGWHNDTIVTVEIKK